MTALYSQAVVEEAGKSIPYAGNVYGRVNASLFGKLLLTYTNPTIKHLRQQEQADIHDLPVPPADLRSQVIPTKSAGYTPPQYIRQCFGHTIQLLWKVWWPEKHALLLSR